MPDAPAAETSAPIRSRTFAALENRDYRRYYAGQGVSLVGTWLQSAAVSWIVFDVTRSERMLGVVEAAGVLPGLLVGLIAGAMADRVPPRAMIVAMQVGQMFLALLLGLLVGTGVVQIWQMIVILAFTRVCVTFEMPSRQVFLYDLVGREALMNAIALNSGLFNASRVLGPALAGLCLAKLGRTACFVLNGLSYLAAIWALLTIRARHRPMAGAGSGAGLGEVLGGLAYLGRDRRVRALFLLMATFGALGMGYVALIPAYARLVVRTEALGYSVLLASGGLGATAGALVVASLGGMSRKERLVPGGMATFATALGAASVLPTMAGRAWPGVGALPVASLCLAGAGFGAIVFFSSTQTLIQTAVPDELRGRIMGVWMLVYSGSVPLGALGAGELAGSRGVTAVMGASAAVCLAIAAATWAAGVLEPADAVKLSKSGDPGLE